MDEREAVGRTDEPGEDEGGGPPVGSAWTFLVEGDGGWAADLQHAAPVPRIGERVEFIAEDGTRRHYQVTDVVHTLQPSSSERPRVREERSLPNSVVTDRVNDDGPRELRAGLPRVIAIPDDQP